MQININARAGFTLVELSIVLVIIGLIIGGVLSGQQIMQNARVTNAINAIQAYEAQFQTYAQNYGVIPGDDHTATTRFPLTNNQSITVGNGDGNGVLNAGQAFDSITLTDETRFGMVRSSRCRLGKKSGQWHRFFWSTCRTPSMGFMDFKPALFNGVFTTTVLCLNNVPAAAAQAL